MKGRFEKKALRIVVAVLALCIFASFLLSPALRSKFAQLNDQLEIKWLQLTTIFDEGNEDPSDQWFRGYINVLEAEESEDLGNKEEALRKYREAWKAIHVVRREHGTFHSTIVDKRLELIEEKIAELN